MPARLHRIAEASQAIQDALRYLTLQPTTVQAGGDMAVQQYETCAWVLFSESCPLALTTENDIRFTNHLDALCIVLLAASTLCWAFLFATAVSMFDNI